MKWVSFMGTLHTLTFQQVHLLGFFLLGWTLNYRYGLCMSSTFGFFYACVAFSNFSACIMYLTYAVPATSRLFNFTRVLLENPRWIERCFTFETCEEQIIYAQWYLLGIVSRFKFILLSCKIMVHIYILILNLKFDVQHSITIREY